MSQAKPDDYRPDEAALQAFAASDPHRQIIERIRPRMLPTHFEFFSARGSEWPLPWKTTLARVA